MEQELDGTANAQDGYPACGLARTGSGREPEQRDEHEDRCFTGVDVTAQAPRLLLGGEVPGQQRGRVRAVVGQGGGGALREFGVGEHRELERQDRLPQRGEPGQALGEHVDDLALANLLGELCHPGGDGRVLLGHRREQQARLVREVPVDGPLGDPGGLRDRADGRLRVAHVAHHLAGGAKEPFACAAAPSVHLLILVDLILVDLISR